MDSIRIEGLTKSYGKGEARIEVLKDLSLKIERGESLAILGASGAGKSTFLNIIGALDYPTSGSVFYGDKMIFDMNERKLAAFRNKTVGFVFQSHHLLPEFSAVENVMLPALIGGRRGGGDRSGDGDRGGRSDKTNFKEARVSATKLLERVGLGKRLEHKPGELSGGEQQRCAIVRALIQSPGVILADEPTGNLDSRTGEEVFELLLELNSEDGTSLIVVTHNEGLASKLSRRVRMTDGRMEEL